MKFQKLLNTSNAKQLIGLLGAIQLNPKNHGKNFRIEQLMREVLLKYSPSLIRPTAPLSVIKKVIENYTIGKAYEDPLSNSFTEVALFEEGNYIVFPGIYADYTKILNDLNRCIFLIKNELPQKFKDEVRDIVGILLYMSDRTARACGLKPYIYENEGPPNITFPQFYELEKYVEAIYFDKAQLREACEFRHYNYETLKEVMLVPGCEELKNADPENNIVNFKPIIEIGEGVILNMPTAVVHSLVKYIYTKARTYNCYDILLELLYGTQFNYCITSLWATGWREVSLPLPETTTILDTVMQFDTNKFAHIIFLGRINKSVDNRKRQKGIFEDRSKEVITYIHQIYPHWQFLTLYIMPQIGTDQVFTFSQPEDNNQSLAFTYTELCTIAQDLDTNALTLWKYAKSYQLASRKAHILAIGGNLDAFVTYKQNGYCLLDSDKETPAGSLIVIVNGSADSFRRKVLAQRNEHAVAIMYQGRFSFARVSRYVNYAPIYIERDVTEEHRIVVEDYRLPIWITNYSKPMGMWAKYICEAVAFWLHKLSGYLYSLFEANFYFEIEIVVDSDLERNEYNKLDIIDLKSINVNYEVTGDTIRIKIPNEFYQLVSQTDNTADKNLMMAVINGYISFLKTNGKIPSLTFELIEQFVNKVMQPSYAKMLLASDITSNIKIDNRNLPEVPYIQEADISLILDSLVSFLPSGYKIPEKIVDIQEKQSLCNDIVTGIIKQIEEKLKHYDGKTLLTKLIAYNEACIQVREFREIMIPARIACFSDIQSEIEDLLNGEKNLVTTAHAIRTLIEFVATDVPVGQENPSKDDIDFLLGLTNQLTEWGSLNEAIRAGFDNPEMGLLPSGRIGTEKTLINEVFAPYAIAKSESLIIKNLEMFNNNYQVIFSKNPVPTKESNELDEAFQSEYGVSMTSLSKVISVLLAYGFDSGNSFVSIEQIALKNLFTEKLDISESEIETSLFVLTMPKRQSIGTPPDGYKMSDIMAWRYNRDISYIRRPLIIVNEDSFNHYYYGYRHLISFTDNLFYLLMSGKFPNPKSSKLKSWLAKISSEKGRPFRNEVSDWFKTNTNFVTIPHEVKITTDSKFKAGKNYGDIDILTVDHERKIIYSIECKNISGGRNVLEIKQEIDEYLGKDGKGGKIHKHKERHTFLISNKDKLDLFIPGIKSYKLISLVITADEIPLSYVVDYSLDIPIKSFVFLKSRGIEYLPK